MSWQKKARVGIAAFVIVFIAIVVIALMQRKAQPGSVATPERRDKACILENTDSGEFKASKDGRIVFAMKFGAQCSYPDGRTRLGNGVEITSARNGKPFTVVSREAEIVQSGNDLNTGHFKGAVKM